MWPFEVFYVPDVHGDIPPSWMVSLQAGQVGPSGEPVLAGGLKKVKSADDCAKARSREKDCDAFSFAYFQSNPTKDAI